MKQGIKILVGSLVLASTLIACGSKGGSGSAATAATGAYGACVVQNGACVSGVSGGIVGQGRWSGRLIVSNVAQYQAFLAANGMCSQIQPLNVAPQFRAQGAWGQLPCTMASMYLDLTVETVEEILPGRANFKIVSRFNNGGGKRLESSADAYMNAAQNGFQLSFVRQYANGAGYNGIPYNGGIQRYDRYGRMIPTTGYGYNGYNPAVNNVAQSPALQIVLTYADQTRTLLTAQVTYGGVLIATTSGTMPLRGTFNGQFNAIPNSYVPGQFSGNQYAPTINDAPEVMPYTK